MGPPMKRISFLILFFYLYLFSQPSFGGEQSCPFVFTFQSRLEMDAKNYQLPIQQETIFRFDNRSPMEILKAGGFFPNPLKPKGDIYYHVEPNSLGTSNYVSMTYLENQTLALLTTQMLPKEQLNITPEWKKKLHDLFSTQRVQKARLDILSQLFDLKVISEGERTILSAEIHSGKFEKTLETLQRVAKKPTLRARIRAIVLQLTYDLLQTIHSEYAAKQNSFSDGLVIYEYKIEGVRGLDVSKIGIDEEAEISVEYAPLSSVHKFRRIIIISSKDLNIQITSSKNGEAISPITFDHGAFEQMIGNGNFSIVFEPWLTMPR